MENWRADSVRLIESPVLTRKYVNKGIKYGDGGCCEQMVAAYLDAKRVKLPYGPSVEDVCNYFKERDPSTVLVYHDPDQRHTTGYVYGTTGNGNRAAEAFLISVDDQTFEIGEFTKLLCIMYDESLYPEGHCIVLRKMEDGNWNLMDPLFGSKKSFAVPSTKVEGLVAGSSTVFGKLY
jgi:hypothetical protein